MKLPSRERKAIGNVCPYVRPFVPTLCFEPNDFVKLSFHAPAYTICPAICLLSICRPSGCTVASGVVGVVVVGVYNRSQMRNSKCTCLIFGVSIDLDPGYKCTEGIFDRSKFKVTRDISPTISGWLLVVRVWLMILACLGLKVKVLGKGPWLRLGLSTDSQ